MCLLITSWACFFLFKQKGLNWGFTYSTDITPSAMVSLSVFPVNKISCLTNAMHTMEVTSAKFNMIIDFYLMPKGPCYKIMDTDQVSCTVENHSHLNMKTDWKISPVDYKSSLKRFQVF